MHGGALTLTQTFTQTLTLALILTLHDHGRVWTRMAMELYPGGLVRVIGEDLEATGVGVLGS